MSSFPLGGDRCRYLNEPEAQPWLSFEIGGGDLACDFFDVEVSTLFQARLLNTKLR